MDDIRRWSRVWAVSVAVCAVVWAAATGTARVLDKAESSKVL